MGRADFWPPRFVPRALNVERLLQARWVAQLGGPPSPKECLLGKCKFAVVSQGKIFSVDASGEINSAPSTCAGRCWAARMMQPSRRIEPSFAPPSKFSRKRTRSGDRPGLQNRRAAGFPVAGAFDSHTLPPKLMTWHLVQSVLRKVLQVQLVLRRTVNASGGVRGLCGSHLRLCGSIPTRSLVPNTSRLVAADRAVSVRSRWPTRSLASESRHKLGLW